MAHIWLLCLVAAAVSAEVKLDCKQNSVSLVWTDSGFDADPSLLRLGNCFPSSFLASDAMFKVDFDHCNFRKMVTGNQLVYTNDLVYMSSPDSHLLPFSETVACAYERPKDWTPVTYEPLFHTWALGDIVFHLQLMNDDFSGPAESTTFVLGSIIPIMGSVEQSSHQPLLLLLDECIAATTPDLQPGSDMYPIITNKGCLIDSKKSRSRFEPRQQSSEIHLSLQAFKFALGQEVFIHCQLWAWDSTGLDNSKKACHYIKDHGWQLLDNPSHSRLCDCCDSTCSSRRARSVSGTAGIQKKAVLGPLTILDS
ncbi:zona pellucida sperm-binding protein 3-like [Thalassophryne amazonica]|uniref:zona pellucida sperm-binding protein 3-like n=1 Tax=Thalassophryne amazonica TaxID=390379 RepID=UPI001471907A|nr:zona pellucida sperm-binding protein 3-like [Thalassophryne amazonica]